MAASCGADHDAGLWLPDGRLLLTGNRRLQDVPQGLFVMGQDLRQVTPLRVQANAPQAPALSPDRKQLAFVSGREVFTVPLTGGTPKRWALHEEELDRVTRAPDGQTLLVTDAKYNLLFTAKASSGVGVLDRKGERLQDEGWGLLWR